MHLVFPKMMEVADVNLLVSSVEILLAGALVAFLSTVTGLSVCSVLAKLSPSSSVVSKTLR